MGVAALLALAVWLTLPPRYRCTATFADQSVSSRMDRRLMETELVDSVRRVLERENVDQNGLEPMRTEWTADGLLSIAVVTTQPKRAVSLLTEAAGVFVETLRQHAVAARKMPTNAEQVLGDYATLLQHDLAEANKQVRGAMDALPDVDARTEQGALMSQWVHVRTAFKAKRSELADASRSLERLRTSPEPSSGLVSADRRREALEADDALQNDLGELAVNLNELKLYMLNVGVQTTPVLDALAAAADAMRSTTATAVQSDAPADLARILAAIDTGCAAYHESFNEFANQWHQTFDGFRTKEVDPLTASILIAYRELTERLDRFLFSAAAPLTAMRRSVNQIGQLRSDRARYHLLQSDLARAFHRLQTAHHRFEFEAGRLEGADNFRLDAARRSAFGLYRRTQARIHKIDERLEREAVESARRDHQRALTTAETLVRRVRGVTDQTVDQLVQLQERLNSTVEDAVSFQEALRMLDVAAGKLEVIRGHLDETQARLTHLRNERLSAETDPRVRLVRCGVDGEPMNRMERVRASALTFGISVLTILLGQWWAMRNRVAE